MKRAAQCYCCDKTFEADLPGIIASGEILCEACRSAKVEQFTPERVVGEANCASPGSRDLEALGLELGEALRPVLASHSLLGDLPSSGVEFQITFSGPKGEPLPWVKLTIDPEFARKVLALVAQDYPHLSSNARKTQRPPQT